MFAQNCIDTSVPFLRLHDEVGYALELMQEYKTTGLAVVEAENFIGIITENILLECDDAQQIQALEESFFQHTLDEGTHVFDVLKKSSEENTYYFAIVNSEKEYIGITTPERIIDAVVQSSSVAAFGGIMVLELEAKNYSLVEIAKIVESNNALILDSSISLLSNQNLMHVSLKINKSDLKDILLTFERYQYNVISVIHQSEYDVQLKERYDSLMRYLEV